MLKKIIPISILVSICLLFLLLNNTTPANIGPFGILVVFVLAYLSLLGLTTYILYGFSRIISYLSTVFIARKPLESLTFKRSYFFSTIIAAAPVMIIGLQSVGAAGIYGYLLVAIFILIGCIYISKRIH